MARYKCYLELEKGLRVPSFCPKRRWGWSNRYWVWTPAGDIASICDRPVGCAECKRLSVDRETREEKVEFFG